MKQDVSSPAAAVPSVLLIGPEARERAVLQSILQKAGCRTFVCARRRDAADLVKFASVVVCEPSLSDGSWLDILRAAQALAKPPAFIVTSRLKGSAPWGEPLSLGVYEVLAPPFRPEEVMRTVRNAHDGYTLPREVLSDSPTACTAAARRSPAQSMGENGQRCAFSGSNPAPPAGAT